MALPPRTPSQGNADAGDAFLREVEENLRRDEMADMAKKHGRWLIAALLAALAAAGAWFFWQDQQRKQAEADGETMMTTLDALKPGRDNREAVAAFDKIAQDGAKGSRGPALLGKAAIAAEGSDHRTASQSYAALAADSGVEQPYRDLALLRRVMIDFDTMPPDAVIATLKPLVEPGKPFFGTAGELTATAMLAKGDKAGAGQLFARIAADNGVPQTIRTRTAQYAGTLGVDASAALVQPEGKN